MSETAVGLISLALAAAGTGTSMAASASEKDAMNKKTEAEVLRQQGYQKKSTGEFQQSLAKSGAETAQKQIDTGAAQRLAEMQKIQSVPVGGASPLDLSAPNTVQAGQAAAQLGQQAQAKAKLGGYSDFDLQQWIKNLRAQQQIGMYGQFAKQSAQVLPYELQAAATSAETERGIGTGLSALGSLVGVGGAAGALGGGASAASGAAQGASQLSWLKYLSSLGGAGYSMFGQRQPNPQQSYTGP